MTTIQSAIDSWKHPNVSQPSSHGCSVGSSRRVMIIHSRTKLTYSYSKHGGESDLYPCLVRPNFWYLTHSGWTDRRSNFKMYLAIAHWGKVHMNDSITIWSKFYPIGTEHSISVWYALPNFRLHIIYSVELGSDLHYVASGSPTPPASFSWFCSWISFGMVGIFFVNSITYVLNF